MLFRSRFSEQKKMHVVKPLLADLIDSVESYCAKTNHPKVDYNIEIKSLDSSDNIYHPAPAEYADLLMHIINAKRIADRVIIQSFDPRSLKVVREKYPGMILSFLIDAGGTTSLRGFKKLLGFKPEIISPDYSLLNRNIIDSMHQQNIRVIPWTVDDIEAARKLYSWGVDGIITDYPDKINLKTIKQ